MRHLFILLRREQQLKAENVNVSSPSLHLAAVFCCFFFLRTIHLYEDTRGFVPLERDLALSIGIKNKSPLVLPLHYYIFPPRLPIIHR